MDARASALFDAIERVDAFVPGRVCLVGEHSDWASERAGADGGGAAVVVCTREGIRARARRGGAAAGASGGGGRFRIFDGPAGVERDASDVDGFRREAEGGGYWSYACGAYAATYEWFAKDERARMGMERGTTIDIIDADLPAGKGLSSSAAICCLVVRCLNLAHGLGLDVREEMRLAYEGERLTPSKCGQLDQACIYGPETCVHMTFDGDAQPACEVIDPPNGGDIHLVVCDLNGKKDTIQILRDLQMAYDAGDVDLRAALGSRNRRHVADCVEAIKRGDAKALGRTYVEAQATFDAATRHLCSELEAPLLRGLLADVHRDVPETVFGSKGVGSQGDGAAQFVCPSESMSSKLRQYLHSRNLDAYAVTIRSRSS